MSNLKAVLLSLGKYPFWRRILTLGFHSYYTLWEVEGKYYKINTATSNGEWTILLVEYKIGMPYLSLDVIVSSEGKERN